MCIFPNSFLFCFRTNLMNAWFCTTNFWLMYSISLLGFWPSHSSQFSSRMHHVKAALASLELAHTGFKQHKLLLKKALNATNKNERAIKNKMKSLLDALREVNACYTCWASRSGLSDEALSSLTEKHNTIWLINLWGEVDSLKDQVDKYLETKHSVEVTSANKQPNVVSKGSVSSLEMDISSIIQTLLSKTSPKDLTKAS